MDLSNLKPAEGSRRRQVRLGRGTGSGLGKTSGRGHKGKGARSGGNTPPGYEGGQMPLQRRVPKRGFRRLLKAEHRRDQFEIVNLRDLAQFGEGASIDPAAMAERGLVTPGLKVKILGDGELKVRLTVRADAFSKSAQNKIAQAGGTAELIQQPANQSLMLEGFGNASRIPELRRRLLFTAAMLAVYRIGVAVPTPGIDGQALAAFFDAAAGTLFGWVNLFSGGALERFSVFALGIMPYISVAIILDLLKVASPYLDELYKEGEAGRRKITQYTRYGTVGLSIVQGLMIAISLEKIQAPGGGSVVYNPGWSFRIITVLTVTAGAVFVMWLGEQITERGIGNGISLVIMAGIVARLPSALSTTVQFVREGEMSIFLLIFIIVVAAIVTGGIVYLETAQRRIPVQYARRVVGRRVYGGQSSHLPLKINTSGVIPPIFASSILVFPATLATFIPQFKNYATYLTPGGVVYDLIYVALIVFFCYFYTAVTFNPVDVADNLKKYGGFIPGIRPGRFTAEYIDRVLSRITLGGAIYVSAVCVLPTILIERFNVPFYFGGTALLIVVGVALDTVAQIETHLLTRNYEGFMRRGRVKSRRTS